MAHNVTGLTIRQLEGVKSMALMESEVDGVQMGHMVPEGMLQLLHPIGHLLILGHQGAIGPAQLGNWGMGGIAVRVQQGSGAEQGRGGGEVEHCGPRQRWTRHRKE